MRDNTPGSLPAKDELLARVADGRPISQAEASAIAHAESEITGRGPIKGGPASVAQSIHDKQQHYFEVAGEVARKPAQEVTQEDAAQVQRAEVRTSHAFVDFSDPPAGGLTSYRHVR